MFKFFRKKDNNSSRNKNTRNRKRSFQIECLEDRQMKAGDVTAALFGNTLYLSEAANQVGAANFVQISKLASGAIRVDGRDMAHASANPINGAAYQDFTLAGNMSLTINFGGGNDTVRIMPGTVLNAVGINTGGSGPDVDTIDINGLKTFGAVQISTGAGVDNVFVQNSTIGDNIGQDDLTINTGAGIDYVQVGNLNSYQIVYGSVRVTTFTSINEAETDRVVINLTTARDYINVDTGAGDDTVNMTADYAGQDAAILTSDGADTVALRDCSARDQFFLLLGNGNDSANLQNIRANTLYVDGGAGSNTLDHYYDGPTNGTTYTGFTRVNGHLVFSNLSSIAPVSPTKLSM